ncbi:MAG: TonB-dependent receptor plug domain-containing protein, partial [Fidelibacterota bacterium]
SDNPDEWYIESSGDEAMVSMNPNSRLTVQGKLSFKQGSDDRFNYSILYQRMNWRDYTHRFKYNPDGDYRKFRRSYQHTGEWTHVVSSKTFFSLKFSNFSNKYEQYVYKDKYDKRYVNPQRFNYVGSNAFYTGGTRMWHFYRSTATIIGKFDYTSQMTKAHKIQFGAEGRRHKLWLHEFQLKLSRETNWQPEIGPLTSWNHNSYVFYPVEGAFYIQDKMEFKDMIVNAGLRFDYFFSDGKVPTNFRMPAASKKRGVKSDTQLSPRFGISYPISDRGAIHVSYGHFFQIPTFEYLYLNPEFEVYPIQSAEDPPPQSMLNTMGNAELKPQKTVIYEVGLKQALTENFGLEITGYYKDIRNLLGTEIHETIQGTKYARYINRDYGNVKGITIALEKKSIGSGIGASVDYTYQVAKGNASDPNAVFLDQQTEPPVESEKQMVPLDWDRTHSLNMTVTLNMGPFNMSVVGKMGSGLPYTPTFQNVRTAVENSERKPPVYDFDLYFFRDFRAANMSFSPFLKVYNLFDRMNEINVYSDTGRAGYSLAGQYYGEIIRGINDLQEFLTRPDFYSEPRQIITGVSVNF